MVVWFPAAPTSIHLLAGARREVRERDQEEPQVLQRAHKREEEQLSRTWGVFRAQQSEWEAMAFFLCCMYGGDSGDQVHRRLFMDERKARGWAFCPGMQGPGAPSYSLLVLWALLATLQRPSLACEVTPSPRMLLGPLKG
jgi:hypothetical protein